MHNRIFRRNSGLSKSSSTPAPNPFQSRPFAPPQGVSPQSQDTEDLEQLKQKALQPKNFGFNFANVNVTPRQTNPLPMLHRKLMIGQPGDKYEQAADMEQPIPAPESRTAGEGTLKRQEMRDDEDVRLKPDGGTLQHMEISQVNLKSESEKPTEASNGFSEVMQKPQGIPIDQLSFLAAGANIIQACWITTGDKKIPLYGASKGLFSMAQLEPGVQVEILDKTQPSDRYKIKVLSGKFKDQEGWIEVSRIEKRSEEEEKTEKMEQEEQNPPKQNAFDKLFLGQQNRKMLREQANIFSSKIPNEMKAPSQMSSEFQDKFGGSSDIFDPMQVEDFDTPPSSQEEHENASRRLATREEIEQSLILNLGTSTNQDFSKYGGNYNQYTLYSNNQSYEVKKEDRHHARFSTLAFNEAAKQMESQTLKAVELSEKEKAAKQDYLTQVRKERKLEGKGGTFMHQPDQQFVPPENPARSKGGSLMGTHYGTNTANAMMGQVLHNKHPQYKKARTGVKSWVVKEKDGHHYKYEIKQPETEQLQSESQQELEQDENSQEQAPIIESLEQDGWSTDEIKTYYLDVDEDEECKNIQEARELLVYYYIVDKVGSTKKDFEKVEKPRERYLKLEINSIKFKKQVLAIVKSESLSDEDDENLL